MHRVLQRLAWAATPIGVDALREAVSINDSDDVLNLEAFYDKEEILRSCGSLIRLSPGSATFEFAHFTVGEFLLSIDPCQRADLSPYCLRRSADLGYLAQTCLKRLCLEDDIELSSYEDDEMLFKQYALWYATYHLRGSMYDDPGFSLCKRVFGAQQDYEYRQLVKHILKQNSYDLPKTIKEMDEPALDSILASTSPLHFAALLRLSPVCSWLLCQGCDVNQSSM